ncbi:hypothetical protein IFR05_002489 [Cadophora sp. M221]|nr:hypothetical protein IFR05_002489 [Cadophora sp. M221]
MESTPPAVSQMTNGGHALASATLIELGQSPRQDNNNNRVTQDLGSTIQLSDSEPEEDSESESRFDSDESESDGKSNPNPLESLNGSLTNLKEPPVKINDLPKELFLQILEILVDVDQCSAVHMPLLLRTKYGRDTPTRFTIASKIYDEEKRLEGRYSDYCFWCESRKTRFRHWPDVDLLSPFGMGDEWYEVGAKIVLDSPMLKDIANWREYTEVGAMYWFLSGDEFYEIHIWNVWTEGTKMLGGGEGDTMGM